MSAWRRVFVACEGKLCFFEFTIQGHQHKIDDFWFVTSEICGEEIIVEGLRGTRGGGRAEDGGRLGDEERESACAWVEEDTEVLKILLMRGEEKGREREEEVLRAEWSRTNKCDRRYVGFEDNWMALEEWPVRESTHTKREVSDRVNECR